MDLATVAAGFVANVEIRVVVMDLIRRSELPLIEFAFGVASIAIVAIGLVRGPVFSHGSRLSVKLELSNTGNES